MKRPKNARPGGNARNRRLWRRWARVRLVQGCPFETAELRVYHAQPDGSLVLDEVTTFDAATLARIGGAE